MINLHLPIKLFYMASAVYGAGLVSFILKQRKLAFVFLTSGFFINFLSELVGRLLIWPFCNMFAEAFFLPFSLSGTAIFLILKKKKEGFWLYPLIVVFCLVAVFLSEGYYPPFTLMSKSIFAHLFHLSVFLAHSCLFSGFFVVLIHIIFQKRENCSHTLLVWGYVFLTVSGLFGMVWSYIGRGDVISWNYYFFHSIGVWVYFSAFLHFYLTKKFSFVRSFLVLLVGVVLIFWLDLLPQIGKINTIKTLNTKLYELF